MFKSILFCILSLLISDIGGVSNYRIPMKYGIFRRNEASSVELLAENVLFPGINEKLMSFHYQTKHPLRTMDCIFDKSISSLKIASPWRQQNLNATNLFKKLVIKLINMEEYILQERKIKSQNMENFKKKRNAFASFKRQQFKEFTSRPLSRLIPSISAGTKTDLGNYFDSIQRNVDILENDDIAFESRQLLSGNHPLQDNTSNAIATAAFLHAFRSYRPTQKIRSLSDMSPGFYPRGNYNIDPRNEFQGLG